MEMSPQDRNLRGGRPDGGLPGNAGSSGVEDLLSDRREVSRLRGLWDDAAFNGAPPALDTLTRFLGSDGWDRRFLVAQDPDPLSSVFITCGAVIDEMLGEDVKGRTLRDITWAGCQPLFDACIQAAMTRAPIAVSGVIRSFAKIEFPFRAVILPFGSSRDCIPYLLGAVGRRTGPAEEE